MAAMNKAICIVLVAAVFFVAGEATISCGNVASYVSPCIPYLIGNAPFDGCCGGVKGHNAAAKTTPDRQVVCGCLKSISSSNSAISAAKAAGLPGQCGVNIPYKISPSTDCSKYITY